MIKLDYTLKTVEERKQLVERFLEETPNPSSTQLETLADYMIFLAAAQEAKEQRVRQRKIITENRASTINKRETSFEGLAAQFESGEDGVYGLMNEDKNIILSPKKMITKKDVEIIPELRQVREAIAIWENIAKTSSGRDAYIAKAAAIELRKDQYVIKDSFYYPITLIPSMKTNFPTRLDGNITVDPDDFHCSSSGVTLINPDVICAILCNYSKLKHAAEGKFERDLWALMLDFDPLVERALKPFPLYEKIVEYKIDNLPNIEIQQLIEEEFGIKHTVEYISTLWRNKIPLVIAAQAEEEYLFWYFENSKDTHTPWKVCTRCGQRKPATEKFFSHNTGTRSGFYSICKKCRNDSYKAKKNSK